MTGDLFSDHLTPETRAKAAEPKKPRRSRPECLEAAYTIAGLMTAPERDDARLRNLLWSALWQLDSEQLAGVAVLISGMIEWPGGGRLSPPVQPPPDTGHGYDDR